MVSGAPTDARRDARRFAALVSLVVVLCLIGAPDARSHTPRGELRTIETMTLGAEHASEHAAIRRQERRARRMTPAELRRARGDARRINERLERRNRRLDPRRFGQWTTAPFEIPAYAIHSALLPTGKVLFWGYPRYPSDSSIRPNFGRAFLWNPALGSGPESFEEVAPPVGDPDGDGPQEPGPLPIYCSGQSLLANGSLLVTGGNIEFPTNFPDDAWEDWGGLNSALTFDPYGESWVVQPSMAIGRWYPSQVLLADGGTLVVGGFNEEEPGGVLDDTAEIFVPPEEPDGVGRFEQIADYEGDEVEGGTLYPHMFVLPDERVAVAGPLQKDTTTLDLGGGYDSADWQPMDNMSAYRQGGTAVLEPGPPRGASRLLEIGGYNYDSNATRTTEKIDLERRKPIWRAGASLRVARSYHNTVLLPDGTMATVGGGSGTNPQEGNYRTSANGSRRQIELYDPAGDRWRLGPAQVEDRTYHSVALLLPDGRVWSAGDDRRPLRPDGGPSDFDTGEIYSPPYMFKGERPVIRNAPKRLKIGDDFAIRAGRGATKAVLVAPGAPTHGVDMSQRLVRLKQRAPRRGDRRVGRLRMAAPPSAGVAPPGHYMLFALNDRGVPSVAEWVEVQPAPSSAGD